MSESPLWKIHTDGGARGNPGPAAYAYVIDRPGQTAIEAAGRLGTATNNIAEYTALVRALEHALKLGARRLHVHSDSELMVKQMNGVYKVKHEGLRPLYEHAQKLCRQFEAVKIQHVFRERNKHADRLYNEVLDGLRDDGEFTPADVAVSPAESVREQVLACLRRCASAWANGDATKPAPEDVCGEVWAILEKGGALK
jgi:ribonuclease HI